MLFDNNECFFMNPTALALLLFYFLAFYDLKKVK